MRWRVAVCLLLGGLAGGVCRAEDTAILPPQLCSDAAGAPACQADKKDLKAARKAFNRGLKLERKQDFDQALDQFEEAAHLVPQNIEYLTARELTRQHLAGIHLERGNDDLLSGKQVEALGEFRAALNLDPQNEFAQQRINDALGPPPAHPAAAPRLVDSSDAITAKPAAGVHDFNYRGDSRGLVTAVASSYGLTVVFDDTFPNRQVRFELETADFTTAIQSAAAATKSFIFALEDTVLYACAETPDNHRLYDRLGLRTFYVPSGDTPTSLNEVLNSLRTLFEFKFATLNNASSTITIRGPLAMLEAATQYLEQLNTPRPQVMLDLKVFQVDHTYAHNLGIHIPNNFNLINIPAAALAGLGGENIQTLINQLIASGGINQAGNQTIAALLAQLQGQQNSIFSQPLATFGGGLTFMGLSLDHLAGALSMNESSVRSLEHVQLRATQGNEATFKLGSRYPIMNASFAPIYNNSAIASVIGNQSYTTPFPSVNYEDIGLSLKAKPAVHHNSDISLELEIQLRTLGTTNSNGIPDILNREFKGGIVVKEGEPAVVAGMVSKLDQRSLSGVPAFAQIPGFGVLASQNSKQEEEDELLLLITPYIVNGSGAADPPVIWLK